MVLDVRINAGLMHGEVLDHLTDRKTRFVGRLKTNAVLDQFSGTVPWRPVGRTAPRGL